MEDARTFFKIGWLVEIGLIVILAVTNPARPVHMEVLREATKEKMGLPGALLMSAVDAVGAPFRYHNLLVCSYVDVESEDPGKKPVVVSIGVLGNVFVGNGQTTK